MDPIRIVQEKTQEQLELQNPATIVPIRQGFEAGPYEETYDTSTVATIMQRDADKDLRSLITACREGNESDIKQIPGMSTTTVRVDSANTEALERMESLNQEAIVVVDDEYKFRGVIERDRILSHIIVELAKSKEES